MHPGWDVRLVTANEQVGALLFVAKRQAEGPGRRHPTIGGAAYVLLRQAEQLHVSLWWGASPQGFDGRLGTDTGRIEGQNQATMVLRSGERGLEIGSLYFVKVPGGVTAERLRQVPLQVVWECIAQVEQLRPADLDAEQRKTLEAVRTVLGTAPPQAASRVAGTISAEPRRVVGRPPRDPRLLRVVALTYLAEQVGGRKLHQRMIEQLRDEPELRKLHGQTEIPTATLNDWIRAATDAGWLSPPVGTRRGRTAGPTLVAWRQAIEQEDQ